MHQWQRCQPELHHGQLVLQGHSQPKQLCWGSTQWQLSLECDCKQCEGLLLSAFGSVLQDVTKLQECLLSSLLFVPVMRIASYFCCDDSHLTSFVLCSA